MTMLLVKPENRRSATEVLTMGVEPLVVLEIGTAKVCALVGLPRNGILLL